MAFLQCYLYLQSKYKLLIDISILLSYMHVLNSKDLDTHNICLIKLLLFKTCMYNNKYLIEKICVCVCANINLLLPK